MHEILFKAKRKDNGEWVYGIYCCMGDSQQSTPHIINYAEDDEFGDWIEVIPETVSQYTGLIDKNGAKIFEGDVLDVCYFLIQNKAVVKFGKHKPADMTNEYECGYQGFYVEVEKGERAHNIYRNDLHFYAGQSVIVGNIFDNPELLKNEKKEKEL